jgi:hypothetical protein
LRQVTVSNKSASMSLFSGITVTSEHVL